MSHYQILINWSPQDDAYVVRVPDLPGCMTDGPTLEGAIHNARDAIAAWLEDARETGDSVPQPRNYDLLSIPICEDVVDLDPSRPMPRKLAS